MRLAGPAASLLRARLGVVMAGRAASVLRACHAAVPDHAVDILYVVSRRNCFDFGYQTKTNSKTLGAAELAIDVQHAYNPNRT